jgi:hypothetical protein
MSQAAQLLLFTWVVIAVPIGFVVLLIRAWSRLSGDPHNRKRDKIGGGLE